MLFPHIGIVVFALAALVYASAEKESSSVLSAGAVDDADKAHFYSIFDGFDKDSFKESHYSSLGNSAFGRETNIHCSTLSKMFDSDNIETRYYALSAAQNVKNCVPKVSRPTILTDHLNRPSISIDEVFYIVASANAAGVKVDPVAVVKLLAGFATKENSPLGLSTILATAAILKDAKPGELLQFAPLVKKIIEQADEMDGKALYFERGAYTTAFAVESIFRFASATQKAPEMTAQQVVKFTNSLYGRRRAHQIRTSARVASALRVLTTNIFVTPVVVYGAEPTNRAGSSGGILVPESRNLKLRLVDVLGQPLGAVSLVAGSLSKLSDDSSNGTLPSTIGPVKFENGFYALELTGVSLGHYSLEIAVKSTKPKAEIVYAGASGDKIPLRVVSSVKIENAQFKYSDTTSSSIDIPITYPAKLVVPVKFGDAETGAFAVHQHSRIRLAFSLADAALSGTSSVEPHQVFVQLTHKTTLQSVTYLCQKSASTQGSYTFTLNAQTAAAEFDHVSGVYTLHLLVGDILLNRPVIWHLTDLLLRFPRGANTMDQDNGVAELDVARLTVSSVAGRRHISSFVGDGPKSVKPELVHTFRTPEPRPSDTLALTFAALCSAPLVVVLLVWPIMGANLRNFPCSLSALLFHMGLGGTFSLYLYYWFELDMFTTLRYLVFIGIFTFFFGNRLLRHLGNERRKSAGEGN